MSSDIRFRNDDGNDYEPSDSEDELTEKERDLLKNARNKKAAFSDSEEEVLGVRASSDDDDEQSDIALSDVEGQAEADDYGMPDAKAWGKNKHKYYSTDYVDPDYGGFQGRDANLAELEEEEAKNLQSELAKSMDDDDFALDFLGKTDKKEAKEWKEDVIKTDVSQLSKRQKLQLMHKESPEFFGLVDDYETKMKIAQDTLYPIVTFWKEKRIEDGKAMEFVNTYYGLILNYCTNIYMYLLLKANKTSIQNHPIIKRLYQFRQLFIQMDPVYKDVIKPQLELLNDQLSENNVPEEIIKKKKKTLKLLTNLTKEDPADSNKRKNTQELQSIMKKPKIPTEISTKQINGLGNVDDSSSESSANEEKVENTEENVEKRGITYQIAKNKGLTPHRKKEQRNPRVKHRNKFRKANIRRKGAVREVRRETSRYGGEISGIKTSVTKSIKIK